MKLLPFLSLLVYVQCMGYVEPPARRNRWRNSENRANRWDPGEAISRPDAGRPRRTGANELRAVCGIPNSNRIINGVEATPHELPWVVALFDSRRRFCTASMISEQWILTAAHCVDGAPPYDVLLGAHNLRLRDEPGRLSIRTTERHLHPQWNPNTAAGDIALIKLPQSVDITKSNIRPICLQNSSDTRDFVGTKVELAGWGKTSDASNRTSATLQKTQASVIDSLTCQKTYESIITKDVMCTSFETSGICLGDSGSAMSIIGGDGRWIQVGVASFVALAGCESGKPNGFTRLHGYLPWIRSVTGLDF